jgi:mono/diheme cytochrome c family protein
LDQKRKKEHKAMRNFPKAFSMGHLAFGLAALVWIVLPLGLISASGAEKGDPKAGKEIYKQLCLSCHGATGKGDGPVGQYLTPKPTDFTKHMGQHDDDYYFKIIKEGGASVGKSAGMPAWGSQLKDSQIWDVISYLKTFAPHRKGKKGP